MNLFFLIIALVLNLRAVFLPPIRIVPECDNELFLRILVNEQRFFARRGNAGLSDQLCETPCNRFNGTPCSLDFAASAVEKIVVRRIDRQQFAHVACIFRIAESGDFIVHPNRYSRPMLSHPVMPAMFDHASLPLRGRASHVVLPPRSKASQVVMPLLGLASKAFLPPRNPASRLLRRQSRRRVPRQHEFRADGESGVQSSSVAVSALAAKSSAVAAPAQAAKSSTCVFRAIIALQTHRRLTFDVSPFTFYTRGFLMDQLTHLANRFNCDHAISIKQPWAWLIVNGIKDIENRNWYTRHIGLVFIHAARRFDEDGYKYIQRYGLYRFKSNQHFSRGGIVGIVEIAGCTKFDPSPWFEGPYGFILRNPKPLPFVPLRGQLGIFNIHHPDVNPFTNRSSQSMANNSQIATIRTNQPSRADS